MKVTDMNLNMSSSEDTNASAHDIIGSGHGAEQGEMTLQWQRALGYPTVVSSAGIWTTAICLRLTRLETQ